MNLHTSWSHLQALSLPFNLKEKPCQENANKLKPRSCVDHLKNGADKCGYYKIYDAAGNGFTVFCDMKTEPGAAWTLIMSWSFKNKLFSNFRYCLKVLKANKFNFKTRPATAPQFPYHYGRTWVSLRLL